MEELRASTIRDVRSCLLTMKGTASLRQLHNDFETFVNKPIPFRQLGYKSLEEFIRSVDSLVVCKQLDGQLRVDARPDPASAHISDMVARQKQAKRKRAPLPAPSYARYAAAAARPQYNAAPHDPMRWRPARNPAASAKIYGGAAAIYQQNVMRIAQQKQFIATTPERRPQQPPPPPAPLQPRNMNSNLPNVQRMQISPEMQLQKQQQQQQQQQVVKTSQASQKPAQRSQPPPQAHPQVVEKAAHSERSNLARVMQRARVSPPSTPPAVANNAPAMQRTAENNATTLQGQQNGCANNGGVFEKSAEFVEGGNPRKDLLNFARFHRLDEPVIKVLERQPKPHRRPQYDCKIKIDGQVFSSYGPVEFYDGETATLAATTEALTQLIAKHGRQRKSSLPISTKASILLRIPALVGKHFNGIWSWQVEADYKDQHQEALPPTWLEIVDASPIVTVEQFGDKFVLRTCTPEDWLQKGKSARKVLDCDLSIPTSSVTFNEKGYVMAKVTSPVSAGEIWCRQVDTEDAESFEALLDEMNKYYQSGYEQKTLKPEERIVKGGYYAAWNNTWHRVNALEMLDDGVKCLFVDVGEELLVPLENVYALERRFAREHSQAFLCRLAGLDAFYDEVSDAIMELEGLVVTLEAADDEVGEDASKIFSVVMYDVETGAALNKDLLVAIAKENATPTLKADQNYQVRVSHIPTKLPPSKSGTFYIQYPSQGYDVLMSMLAELEQELPKHAGKQHPPITRENSKGTIFFAKLEDDARYHRVQIIDSPPDFKFAQILYIDHGRTRVVPMANVELHPLENLNPALCKIPPQAIPVRMHLNAKTVPEDIQTRLQGLMTDASVLLRVHSFAADGTPNVMAFMSYMDELISVGDRLCTEKCTRDAQISPGVVSRFTPPDSPHNVPSTGILQCPKLPKSREYFEVKIPFAVNPWNFFVQPLASSAQLAEMMQRLQATFANRHLEPVNLKEIKDGNIYAAKHTDGDAWYRVCVLKTIYPSAIVVFYVDYGYYANLTYQQLFALDKQFLSLPYQAIKAKLAGIKPMREKWSVDDCRYFEQLVQQREYVSVIMSIEKDELYPCDNVLVLKLIDTTSPQQDVLIGDLLIQRRIAEATSA